MMLEELHSSEAGKDGFCLTPSSWGMTTWGFSLMACLPSAERKREPDDCRVLRNVYLSSTLALTQ